MTIDIAAIRADLDAFENDSGMGPPYQRDVDFAAQARHHVADLCARVEELEREVERLLALLREAVAIGRAHAEHNNDDKDMRRLIDIRANGGIE